MPPVPTEGGKRSVCTAPSGGRGHTHLNLEFATREELIVCLQHLMSCAGNTSLLTRELCQSLADHAAGNYRFLTSMASELLLGAIRQEPPGE
jgi:hypothetical protein